METVHCLMTNDNIMAYGNAVQAESQNNPALASPNLQSQNGTAKTIPYPSTNKPEHENFCKWTIIVLLLSICTTRSTRTSASVNRERWRYHQTRDCRMHKQCRGMNKLTRTKNHPYRGDVAAVVVLLLAAGVAVVRAVPRLALLLLPHLVEDVRVPVRRRRVRVPVPELGHRGAPRRLHVRA
jgi:hypothetical protein